MFSVVTEFSQFPNCRGLSLDPPPLLRPDAPTYLLSEGSPMHRTSPISRGRCSSGQAPPQTIKLCNGTPSLRLNFAAPPQDLALSFFSSSCQPWPKSDHNVGLFSPAFWLWTPCPYSALMPGSVWLPYVLLCPALMFPPQGLGHMVIWFCQATRQPCWGLGCPHMSWDMALLLIRQIKVSRLRLEPHLRSLSSRWCLVSAATRLGGSGPFVYPSSSFTSATKSLSTTWK